MIFKDRHTDLAKELGEEIDDPLDEVAELLENLGGEPSPYLAVLVADGDKMGALISELKTADEHREFSQALAGFAAEARRIVSEHSGVLIYAGGDDVLAFAPVSKCLDCARALHEAFALCLKNHGHPTLSVGIAIGHFMENLEDLLAYGRAAEKAAKQPNRDGLAIHLHKRGGAPIRMRAPWTDLPDERLTRYAQLMLTEAIPSKLPYELQRLADLYEGWPGGTVAQAIRKDVLRVVRDKQPSSKQRIGEIEALLKHRVADVGSLRHFAEELLVARQLATALRQAGERPLAVAEAAS